MFRCLLSNNAVMEEFHDGVDWRSLNLRTASLDRNFEMLPCISSAASHSVSLRMRLALCQPGVKEGIRPRERRSRPHEMWSAHRSACRYTLRNLLQTEHNISTFLGMVVFVTTASRDFETLPIDVKLVVVCEAYTGLRTPRTSDFRPSEDHELSVCVRALVVWQYLSCGTINCKEGNCLYC